MVGLGPGQKPIVMSHYPHMLAEDTMVWTKFLKSTFVEITEVWYDVHVGLSVLRNMGGTSMQSRIANGLTRKRIDVVAAIAGGLWVVEVKPYANMYAVGQILTYARLFRLEYISPGQIIPVLLCDSYDEDLVDEFDELGVVCIVND